MVDFNATAAYKRAGYKSSGNAAEVSACKLLRHPQVEILIRRLQDQAAEKTLVSVKYVVEGLKEVAERCMEREPVMVGKGKNRKQLVTLRTDPETGQIVQANVWQFDSAGANRALELLGKHVGAFTADDDVQDAPMPVAVNIHVVDARKAG